MALRNRRPRGGTHPAGTPRRSTRSAERSAWRTSSSGRTVRRFASLRACGPRWSPGTGLRVRRASRTRAKGTCRPGWTRLRD